MKLKWLFWTVLLAIIVFFSVIYFGVKYDWVSSSQPKRSNAAANQQKSTPQSAVKESDPIYPEIKNAPVSSGNGVKPELIDEEVEVSKGQSELGSADLTIDQVVAQCQSLSETIGVPQQRLEQSISECVDRNSRHLVGDKKPVNSERQSLIREQCNVAITQQELLSNEEIKLLVDECVASMSAN